jgi:phosphoglycerate dehydrogenase-like enzyme
MIHVGLSRDLLTSKGVPSFGHGPLSLLNDSKDLTWEYLPELVTEIDVDLAEHYDALYVNSLRVPAACVSSANKRLKLVARHGVGYDAVDVEAMTRAGVIVTNTPAAVQRPVATAAITFVLALAQRLMVKQELARNNGWDQRSNFMGQGLTGKTLGIVGAGGIGCEIIRLARAFDMRVVVTSPRANPQTVNGMGATLLAFEDLIGQSDFIVLACRLDATTYHLINAQRLALMKPTSYLINVARGSVIDEPALIKALNAGQIAGAALDVFEQEPVAPDNPLLKMNNVIVTPHSLSWTDECFDAIARAGLGSIAAYAKHTLPESIVNREVLAQPAVASWFTADI